MDIFSARTPLKVYVIAEIGINHNGDIQKAKNLIIQAAKLGVDAVKFQSRNLDEIYTAEVLKDSKTAENSSQYLLSELRKTILSHEQISSLNELAQEQNVDFIVTPFDIKSADFITTLKPKYIKIGSPDFTNLLLLEHVSHFGTPLIISTGMSTHNEIKRVVSFLNAMGTRFSLLHCNSTYPAFPQDLNLKYMLRLRKEFGVPVGYSGHERGFVPTLAAVAMGATIIERHITEDKNQTGPDHNASLNINEFASMVTSIREIESSLGNSNSRKMTQGEKNNRISLSKSLVYGGNLRKGTIIGIEHLKAKSPSRGISPLNYQSYIGKRLLTSVKTDQYLRDEHFNGEILSEIKTKHLKNWGVVGRLNDFNNFLDIEPKFIEMHLTWRDLLSFKRLTGNYSQMLTIHAPEYFKDKLVDLTTDDIEISNNSIEAIQQTILLTKKISGKFKQYNKGKPFVVVHPGGHFEHLPPVNKDSLYRNLRENLKKIDTTGVELLIENMPPLPWYFGGQWYNSVFMDAAEIESFVASTGWKICYDISHAALYCNHAKVDLIDHAKTLLPYTRYLHISDAKGSAEEGLQIGEGSVDFKSLAKIFKGKKIPFVPEIWQGHLNSGRGFKEALSKLDYLGWE